MDERLDPLSGATTRSRIAVRELLRRIELVAPITQLSDLRELLEAEMVDDDRFRSLATFDPHRYCRRVLGEVSNVEIVLVGWESGQSTTIHHHEGSLCAYKILRGELVEEQYEKLEGPKRGEMVLKPGRVQAAGAADVHRMRNDGERAVSLHLYTPPVRLGETGNETGGERTEAW
ncbi:MAG: cysteine dioxygenase family protein [Myxococcota bacterium]